MPQFFFGKMTGGVTYDSVESAVGGNIFKDMVFWVAQRVPIRNEILKHIKVSIRRNARTGNKPLSSNRRIE